MTDLDKRIRAFSTKRKYFEKLTVADVLSAMQPVPKPPAISKADLRKQAEVAAASFTGGITRLPTVDPAERPARYEARQSKKPARGRRSSSYSDGSK